MSKLTFVEIKSVTSKGLSEDEAQERINSVILNSIEQGRSIQSTADGYTCIKTHGFIGASMLYYYINSKGNKHSIVVSHDHKAYIYLQTVVGAILLTLLNALFLKLNSSDSVKLGLCGVLGIVIMDIVAFFKSRKKAEADFTEIIQALSAAEKNGEFNK